MAPQGRSVEFLYHLLLCSTPLTVRPSTSYKVVRESRRSGPPLPDSPRWPAPPGSLPLVPHRAPAASRPASPASPAAGPPGRRAAASPAWIHSGVNARSCWAGASIRANHRSLWGVAVSRGSVGARKPTPAVFNPMMILIRWGRDRPSRSSSRSPACRLAGEMLAFESGLVGCYGCRGGCWSFNDDDIKNRGNG